jgi:hypothetical protein
MVIVPVIVNSIQFWVTDTYLKKKTVDIEYSSVVASEDSDLDTDLLNEEQRQKDRRKGIKSIPSSASSSPLSEGFMNTNLTEGKSLLFDPAFYLETVIMYSYQCSDRICNA